MKNELEILALNYNHKERRIKLSRLLVALGIISLILSMPIVFASATWSTYTPMPTASGQAAVIAGDNGLIYVMGGYTGTLELNK